jgi:transposase
MSQKFNDEFKTTIVDLYHNGQSVSSLAKDYGVSSQTIHKWLKATQHQPPKNYTLDEIKSLEQRALKAEQEVDILKKALAIFGKTTK